MELLKAANHRAATHGDVISLCAGQPSTPAPVVALEAVATAVRDGAVLGYTDAMGTAVCRFRVSE